MHVAGQSLDRLRWNAPSVRMRLSVKISAARFAFVSVANGSWTLCPYPSRPTRNASALRSLVSRAAVAASHDDAAFGVVTVLPESVVTVTVFVAPVPLPHAAASVPTTRTTPMMACPSFTRRSSLRLPGVYDEPATRGSGSAGPAGTSR